ncbi:helix-turn-helix domain-containing protein [Hydrogenophaga luteola]|uniref:Helix-turn-helix domain-containing protein n=1 Tax=Hydrogenophaga luteola TaxID=1591122 RepID=A0ABV7W9Z1_9BURK
MTARIPNYALYGDQDAPAWSNSFNFEWIPQRSAPYQWEIQVHRHDAFVQLLCLTAGSGEVRMNGARIAARAPCLIVVPAGAAHGFHFSTDVDGPVVTATQKVLESLAVLLMPGLVDVIRAPRVLALPDTGALEALMPLFMAIERESRSHSEGQTAAGMALLTALLVQVARLAGPADSDPVGNTAGRRKQRQIQQFKSLLDRDFRQHRPVQAYADALGLTAGQLSRICREVLGMSALDVIHARLVHEAQRELVYTVGSIQQLASELGFEDDAYFSRFFKRHTGLSPRDFRAQALAQLATTAP